MRIMHKGSQRKVVKAKMKRKNAENKNGTNYEI